MIIDWFVRVIAVIPHLPFLALNLYIRGIPRDKPKINLYDSYDPKYAEMEPLTLEEHWDLWGVSRRYKTQLAVFRRDMKAGRLKKHAGKRVLYQRNRLQAIARCDSDLMRLAWKYPDEPYFIGYVLRDTDKVGPPEFNGEKLKRRHSL